MKFKSLTVIFTLLAGIVLFSLFGTGGREAATGFTIAGSTSMQPTVEHLAEYYMIKRPKNAIAVQGGGSSSGIEAALNGVAALGMSSRPLKPEEKGLETFEMARDAIAIIVNPRNGTPELTMDELRGVFSGRIKRWDGLGSERGEIHVVTREEGSGTRGAFEEQVMGEKETIDNGAIVQDSSGAVRQIVSNDEHAIGYISLGIADSTVKKVAVDGIEPATASIKNGKYKLVRPFLFVFKGKPDEKVQDFIDYTSGEEAADLVRQAGFIPRLDFMKAVK